MITGTLDAINAYQKTAALPKAASAGPAAGGENFGDMFKGMMGDAVDSIKQAEKVTHAGVLGQASHVAIATAVAEAEVNLQMLTGLRDRMISAYQEITRMGV
jgi:flagellar hook-basal body complex protein FliE